MTAVSAAEKEDATIKVMLNQGLFRDLILLPPAPSHNKILEEITLFPRAKDLKG
jgi:hypothetical protein